MKLSSLLGFRDPCVVFPPDTAEPIRSELFSAERLEQHAATLAAAQHVTAHRWAGRSLAKRVEDNGRVLLEAFRSVERAVRDERAITPADQWLLDNFYLAQEQIRQIHKDLPRSFARGLPKLAGDRSKAIRVCTDWRGPSWPTRTADSIASCCCASLRRISASGR